MIGLIAPKREYYYKAKWVSNDDRTKTGYFSFKIISDDNTYEADLDNLGGETGNAVWETKSAIPFAPEDIVLFRNDKFHIKNIDGNRKAEGKKENAYLFFKNNGNIPIKLQVRKAGGGV